MVEKICSQCGKRARSFPDGYTLFKNDMRVVLRFCSAECLKSYFVWLAPADFEAAVQRAEEED